MCRGPGRSTLRRPRAGGGHKRLGPVAGIIHAGPVAQEPLRLLPERARDIAEPGADEEAPVEITQDLHPAPAEADGPLEKGLRVAPIAPERLEIRWRDPGRRAQVTGGIRRRGTDHLGHRIRMHPLQEVAPHQTVLRARGRTKWPEVMVGEGLGGSLGVAAGRNWPTEVPEPGISAVVARGRGVQSPITDFSWE